MHHPVEPSARPVLRFGTFEVDVAAGELRRQGVKTRLQEQPLKVLLLLLSRPGDVVTREELRAQALAGRHLRRLRARLERRRSSG